MREWSGDETSIFMFYRTVEMISGTILTRVILQIKTSISTCPSLLSPSHLVLLEQSLDTGE